MGQVQDRAQVGTRYDKGSEKLQFMLSKICAQDVKIPFRLTQPLVQKGTMRLLGALWAISGRLVEAENCKET